MTATGVRVVFPPTRRAPVRGASALVAVLAHAAVLGVLWHAATRSRPGPDLTASVLGGRGDGPVAFFLPLAPGGGFLGRPILARPRAVTTHVPVLPLVPVPAVPPGVSAPPTPVVLDTARRAAAPGPGSGGVEGGAGPGVEADPGPGTGRAGDYISVASPRAAILPPLGQVPGAVTGRTYRIRFWVAADGRVTRVAIDPPMPDAGYRRDFLERMLAYQFYPARTRSGTPVASVVTVPLRIGN